MRDIVELKVNGNRLVGTAHWPEGGAREGGVGVLFLNSGFLPRSPVGDLPTHLADSLSQMGLAVFRFDMPGLGDSEGALPADVETFFGGVLGGMHTDEAAALSKQLAANFKLSGLYLGGICGGAVSSVYAAASGKAGDLAGIFLMDPRFKVLMTGPDPSKKGPAAAAANTAPAAPANLPFKKRMIKKYEVARVKVLSTGVGEKLRSFYHIFKPAVVATRKTFRKMQGEPLPADANVPLITAMKTVGKKGIPTLLLMAGTEEENTEKFDYVGHFRRAGSSQLTCAYLPKVTHAFTEADGEQLVMRELDKWFRSLVKTPLRETKPVLKPALA